MDILHLVLLVVLLAAGSAFPVALVWTIWHIRRDRAETRKAIADGYRYRDMTRQIWANRRNGGY